MIGGFALNAWGVVRGTKDLDIVVDRAPGNVEAIAEVAVELGGQVHTGESFVSTSFGIAGALSHGSRTLIETQLGPLDVVQGLVNVPSYGELVEHAVKVEIAGVEVPVCSLDDLRAMKQAAGRPRDLADLDDLDAIEENG